MTIAACISPSTDCASSQALGLIPSIDRTTAAVAEEIAPVRNPALGVVDDVRDRHRAPSQAGYALLASSPVGMLAPPSPPWLSWKPGSSSIGGFGFEFCMWRSV